MKAFVSEAGLRACVHCQSSFRPPGGGAGCCSDRCYVLSRRQEPPHAELGRVIARMGERHERRVLGRARVDRLLGEARLENDIKAYRRSAREAEELIARMQAAPFGTSARPARVTCRECTRAGATPQEAAAIHGGREIVR